ncbi:acyl-CoA thioester hydrolase [Massilia sp. UYP11]|uniref:acyl-CoA thioesterase n=1 Tax=Massilia sp. UYP11 TaxID=1756385 RepID=UPI003D1EE333
MSTREPAATRADFFHFHAIETRWMDNDAYGHVNNVTYYSYFDTAVNHYLIAQGALDIARADVIGLVVETQCRYFSPVAFPGTIEVGLRVGKIGTSSVRYELAIFRKSDDVAAAQGHFVHVYVDRASNRPVALPDVYRRALQPLHAAENSN